MKKYENAVSTIESNYSVEAGASPEAFVYYKTRLVENTAWRKNLLLELKDSLNDPHFSWKNALWNDYCHVEDFETEDQAREFISENVLKVVIECDN